MEDLPNDERLGGLADRPVSGAFTRTDVPPRRLAGQYEHRIDSKGRLVLPASHRPYFSEGGYLQVWDGKCLALFTRNGFEHFLAHVRGQILDQGSASGTSVGSAMRYAYGAAEETFPDAQGRFVIPPRFRDRAPSSTPVSIIGSLDRVEIWLTEALADEDPSAPNFVEIMQTGYEEYPR